MKYASLGIVGVALACAAIAHADIDGDQFTSEQWRVRISAPVNWQLSQQSSYPSILLWMHRRTPQGKMGLSAEQLKTKQTSIEYARRAGKALTKLGFQVRGPNLHAATGAYWIEFDNGKVFLRQALLVSGMNGYSLTLSAPDVRTRRQHLRAFDYALRRIEIDRSVGTRRAPASDSDPDGAPKSEPKSGGDAKSTDDPPPGPAPAPDASGVKESR